MIHVTFITLGHHFQEVLSKWQLATFSYISYLSTHQWNIHSKTFGGSWKGDTPKSSKITPFEYWSKPQIKMITCVSHSVWTSSKLRPWKTSWNHIKKHLKTTWGFKLLHCSWCWTPMRRTGRLARKSVSWLRQYTAVGCKRQWRQSDERRILIKMMMRCILCVSV